MAAVAPPSAEAQALKLLKVTGLTAQELNAIIVPKDAFELTRNERALEHVADGTTVLARALQTTALAQDSLLQKLLQRVDVLEVRTNEGDEAMQLMALTSERNRAGLDARLVAMVGEANSWEAKLGNATKLHNQKVEGKLAETDASIEKLDGKLVEAAKLFLKCDGLLAQLQDAQGPTAPPGFATSAIPIAAGPASSSHAGSAVDAAHLQHSQQQLDLLRQRIDDMQVSLNVIATA